MCGAKCTGMCSFLFPHFSQFRVVKMDLKAMRIAIENCIVCLRIRIVNSMEWNDFTYGR